MTAAVLLCLSVCIGVYNRPINNVIALINNIGEMTEDNYTSMFQSYEEAANAYNALTDTQKRKVSNYSKLRTAYNDYMSFSYKTQLKAAISSINLNMFFIEDMLNTTQKAWYNAIYRKYDEYNKGDYSDFNNALEAVFTAEENVKTMKTINESHNSMTGMLERIKNPPDKYKAAYDAFIKYYGTYSPLKDLSVNPKGSYTSYTSTKNTLISNYNTAYAELKAVFPEIMQ